MSCSGCGRNWIIVNKKYNLCNLCNTNRLHPEKTSKEFRYQKQQQQQKKRNEREPTGELKMFQSLWSIRPHICSGCGERLNYFSVGWFSHCIRKSRGEEFRLVSEIIFIECRKCHDIQDNGLWSERIKLNNFHDKMKVIKKL